MVAAGRVSLDDPLQKYVPKGVAVPSWHENGVETAITLRDLATHTSGLPDEPWNLNAGCPNQQPCAQAKQNYTVQMLWDGIQKTKPAWKPGTNWLYSNYAFGLLGTVLANLDYPNQAPPAYQATLDRTFLGALHMHSTELERPTHQLATAALPTAVLPQATITKMCTTTDPSSCKNANFQMGLAWQLYGADHQSVGVPWAFKDGGTSGMHSVTVLAPSKGVGVTLLSNGGNVEPDPLGAQILKLALAAG